jgi:uncharacterized membrane protein YkvA (DUF1232 family)
MKLVVGVGVALALTYLVLLAALLLARPKGNLLGQALRLLPDLLRLIRRLAADRAVPRQARLRLWLLLAYLAIPFDLVPDFIPVLGYADDAIIVVLVLRSVVRRAGTPVVQRHWPGTDDGLAALGRLTGLQFPDAARGDTRGVCAACGARLTVVGDRTQGVHVPGPDETSR